MYLARQSQGTVVSTTVLAEAMEIPYRFLRRIMLKLAEQDVTTARERRRSEFSRDPATVTCSTWRGRWIRERSRSTCAWSSRSNAHEPDSAKRTRYCSAFNRN